MNFYIEITVLIVAVIALIVACSARFYAEKTFALELFDKRYRIYDEFSILLNDLLSNIREKPQSEYVRRLKFLLWKAQYIFGNDINDLLIQIQEHIVGTITFFELSDDMGNGTEPGDDKNVSLLSKSKKQYEQLSELISKLLGNNDAINLISYFDKYLSDDDFREPLSKTFWRRKILRREGCCSCCDCDE